MNDVRRAALLMPRPRTVKLFSRSLRNWLAIPAFGAACNPSVAAAQPDGAVNGTGPVVSKIECAASFEQSQRLRQAFKYVEATVEALRCADPGCGAALSEECGKLYNELQAATPSVVFAARSEDGAELTFASISVDGRAEALSIDGAPVLLNPGSHEFTFVAKGFQTFRQSTVVRAGERFRPIVGVLRRQSPAPFSSPSANTAPATSAAPRARPTLATYLLGGVGVAGLAGFAGLRIAGASEYDDLARSCKPTCSEEQIDTARRLYTLSYVSLAVGTATSIAAVTLYLTSERESAPHTAVQLRQMPGGMGAHLTGSF